MEETSGGKGRGRGKKKLVPSPSSSSSSSSWADEFSTPLEAEAADVETALLPFCGLKLANWIFKRAVSPSEFYLELEMEPTANQSFLQNYHKWFPELQKFYNDPSKQAQLKVKDTGMIVDGECYVYRQATAGIVGRSIENIITWHRVRVFLTKQKTAKVFFCDLGRFQEVKLSELYQMPKDFSLYPAQLLRCYLADILPKDCENRDGLNWSVEAIAYFKSLASRLEGRLIKGIVISRRETRLRKGFPELHIDLGMVLFLHSSSEEFPCTLNALLVKEGFAISTGIFSSCPHQFGWDWNSMEKVRSSLPGRKKPEAVSIPKIIVEESLTGLLCIPKPYEEYLEMKEKRRQKQQAAQQAALPPPEKEQITYLPAELARILARVNIAYIKGPSHIVLNFLKDAETINEMEEAIRKSVDKPLAEEELTVGKIIAFIAREKEKKEGEPKEFIFYRGIIQGKAENYKVLSIDHGVETVISKDRIFPLHEPFLSIPSFAVRCHLDVTNLYPARGKLEWSSLANEQLVKYALSWQDTNPRFYAFRSFSRECIQLDSTTQDIVLNESKTWVAEPLKKDEYLHNSTLLKPLLRSYGIAMWYEIGRFEEASPYWNFGEFHDDLKIRGDVEEEKYGSSFAAAAFQHFNLIRGRTNIGLSGTAAYAEHSNDDSE